MIHLIDKTAVVEELERLYNLEYDNTSNLSCGKKIMLRNILHFLDTFEVKEVDLEKHLKEDIEDVFFDLDGVAVKGATHYLTTEDVKDIAKYFFELGLKAKQESNDGVKIGETQIYLEDDGGEPPYDGKQWLDLSCVEYIIPKTLFKNGDNVEILIRKAQKGE